MKYCTNCGAQLLDSQIYCDHCGAKQSEAASITPSESSGRLIEKHGTASGKKPGKNRKPIYLAILLAAAVAATAIFSFGFYRAKKADRTQVKAESVQTAKAEEADPQEMNSGESTEETTEDGVTAEESREKILSGASEAGSAPSENSTETAPQEERLPQIENGTVEDVPSYTIYPQPMVHVYEIPEAVLRMLDQEVEENLHNRSQENPNLTINSCRQIGYLFMGKKKDYLDAADSQDGVVRANKIFDLYEVNQTYTEERDGEAYQQEMTVIYYRRFYDIEWQSEKEVYIGSFHTSTPPAERIYKIPNTDGSKMITVALQGIETVEEVKEFLYHLGNNDEIYYYEYLETV